jgi:hypothetical protein
MCDNFEALKVTQRQPRSGGIAIGEEAFFNSQSNSSPR